MGGTNAICKRIIDVVLACSGLIIGSPLLVLIGLAVRLESYGSVVYSQQRVGRNGRYFALYKFRKFPVNWGNQGPGVTVMGDARMTTVGRMLERTKLDELPQLWNILRGEMSFVGPRPESGCYAHLFQGEYAEVLKYTPGIFGPNQVTYRNESEMYPLDEDPETYYRTTLFPKKAQVDLEYFKSANCLKDVGCIIRGLWISLHGIINWRRAVGLHARILALDFLLIEIAWFLTNQLRFSFMQYDQYWNVYVTGSWLIPLFLLPGMMVGGCYRHPIRLFSIRDAIRLVIVVSTGWLLAYLMLLGLFHRNMSFMLAPLGIFVLMPLLVFPRIIRRERWKRKEAAQCVCSRVRVLVCGTGLRSSGLTILLDQGFPNSEVIGFLDDDQDSTGRYILGHRVLGSERDLATIYAVYKFHQLWLTYAPDKFKYERVKKWCDENDVVMVILSEIEPFAQLAKGQILPDVHAASDSKACA